MSDKKVDKAVNSYKNSEFLEYEKLNKNLFYKKGLEFFENKEYKNGEYCFEIMNGILEENKYKDARNYYNYCKAQNLLADNDLESYDYFKKCAGFLDSRQILETNKYFKLVDKIQGEWYFPGIDKEQNIKEMRNSGEYYEIDGVFYPKKNYSSYKSLLEEIENESFSAVSDALISKTIRTEPQEPATIEIYGGKNLSIWNDTIEYDGEGSIEFINDKTITIGGRKFTKR